MTTIIIRKETVASIFGTSSVHPHLTVPQSQQKNSLSIEQMQALSELLQCISKCWEMSLEIIVQEGGAS